jgi:hypothetical protein
VAVLSISWRQRYNRRAQTNRFLAKGQNHGSSSTQGLDYDGNPFAAFQELMNTYHSPNAYPGYRLPKPRSAYPSGPPLYGEQRQGLNRGANSSARDPAGEFDGTRGMESDHYEWHPYPVTSETSTWNAIPPVDTSGSYMHEGSAEMVMPALCSRIMGFTDLWQEPSFFDYVDRYCNDIGIQDQFGLIWNYTGPIGGNDATDVRYHSDNNHGGSGNGFCLDMWNTYRYPGGRKIIVL